MKGIYRFVWDCGRMGYMSGIFIAESRSIETLIGKDVDFGEALGKHSEIEGTIEEGDVLLVTDDVEAVSMFEKYKLTTGYNPLEYIRNQDDEDDE
jgi:hypothetical protein